VGNDDRVRVSWDQITPRFRAGVRLTYDEIRGQMALLHPEGVALLNGTGGRDPRAGRRADQCG
jgi:hypothetical protein